MKGQQLNMFVKLKKLFSLKKILVGSLVITGIVSGWYFFFRPSSAPDVSTTSYIRTTTLSKSVLEETISSTGSVSSNHTSNVSAKTSAIISEILVSVGDIVEEGDIMITLEQENLLDKIDEIQADIQEVQETLQETYDQALEKKDEAWGVAYADYSGTEDKQEDALSALNNASSTLTVYQTTYDQALTTEKNAGTLVNNNYNAWQNALAKVPDDLLDENYRALKEEANTLQTSYDESLSAYDIASTALNDATTALNEAKNRVNYTTLETSYQQAVSNHTIATNAYLAAESALTNARENLEGDSNDMIENLQEQLENYYQQIEEYTLTASSSGTITSINATVGATSGNGTLVVIEDTNDLIIEISVDESDIKSVEVGMSCKIYSDATDNDIHGVVTSISPVASSSGMGSTASTFSVSVSVQGNDSGLLIGMNAQVDIILSQSEGVYAVPIDAIEEMEGVTYVYQQVGKDQFELMEVYVGQENNYYVEISGPNVVDGIVIRSSAIIEEATSNTEQPTFPGMGMMNGDMSEEMQRPTGDRSQMSGGSGSMGKR